MTPQPSDRTAHRVATLPFVALASVFALAAQGCAAPAPARVAPAPVDVPGAWQGAEAAASNRVSSLAQWWLRFDDPLLSDLIAQALRANTSVQGAQAALRQARALRDVAAAALWPALGLSASAQRSKAGNDSAANRFNAGLDASWEPDVFGGNRSAVDASDAAAQASRANLGDVQVSIAAEVALNFIALRRAQARRQIADDNLLSQLETLQITQWRLQAGLVTSIEAEQARAAVEQTRAQLPALQIGIEQAGFALAVLAGKPPASLTALLAVVAPVPQPSSDLTLSFPADTLRQRPDVRSAEYQVTAARARVAQADAALAPNFRLSGSLGLSAATLGLLTNGASVVTALLASAAWPLFDGGAARAQVRAQEAALDQAHHAYRAAVLVALKDVENALVALRGDRARLQHLQQAADAAANAALLARERYAGGLVDFQVVLETQRTQLNAQDSVASASADVGTDHVRLYKALGGGWDPDDAASIHAAGVSPS
jgi:outer membrane protein, multidrug efflux system